MRRRSYTLKGNSNLALVHYLDVGGGTDYTSDMVCEPSAAPVQADITAPVQADIAAPLDPADVPVCMAAAVIKARNTWLTTAQLAEFLQKCDEHAVPRSTCDVYIICFFQMQQLDCLLHCVLAINNIAFPTV